jgi:hypothetical protein
LNQDDLDNLQRRTADAITEELPPGWTFLCCLIAPDGRRHFSGSVHANPLGQRFIADLQEAMDVQVWRIPPKVLPTKVTTPTVDTNDAFRIEMTERWVRDSEGVWLVRNGKLYPTKPSMVNNRESTVLMLP